MAIHGFMMLGVKFTSEMNAAEIISLSASGSSSNAHGRDLTALRAR